MGHPSVIAEWSQDWSPFLTSSLNTFSLGMIADMVNAFTYKKGDGGMLDGFLMIAAIGTAILAIIENADSFKAYSRKNFIIVFLLVSAPFLLIASFDIIELSEGASPLTNPDSFLYMANLTDLVAIYLLLVSYPFFQRVCWRINDASAHKALCYISLIPGLNILIFAYLCLKRTAVKAP